MDNSLSVELGRSKKYSLVNMFTESGSSLNSLGFPGSGSGESLISNDSVLRKLNIALVYVQRDPVRQFSVQDTVIPGHPRKILQKS